MIDTDSISKIELKNNKYGNRALFITVSPATMAQLKSDVHEATKDLWVYNDPVCEFPWGSGKLREWINANIQIPEGYKGCERVIVKFYVQPDGSITDAKLFRPSKNNDANAEALRLVGALPKFRVKFYTPQKHRIGLMLPITFTEPGAIFIRGKEILIDKKVRLPNRSFPSASGAGRNIVAFSRYLQFFCSFVCFLVNFNIYLHHWMIFASLSGILCYINNKEQ